MRAAACGSLRSFFGCDLAVATIEAAVVLPFVLLLGVGTIEFGWILSQIGSVQSSLRDAVRYASRSQLVPSSGGSLTLSTSVVTRATAMVNATFASNGISTKSVSITIKTSANTDGSLFRGGASVYTVHGVARFAPVSAGLLAIVNVTIPEIQLSFEARHVGN